MSQFSADCLNEIFEYLENDKVSLHSCLLVNRLWCEVSVRILWRNIYNYNEQTYNTLISCLPNESKEILSKNEIIISTPTSKFPIFNYVSFCKVLSIRQVYKRVENLLKNQKLIVVTQELLKMFVKQTTLKKLSYDLLLPNLIFTSYPEAKYCFKNLSELECRSDIKSEFFYQLSQICHNIQSLTISVTKYISNGLTDLISVQRNLKFLDITQCYNYYSMTDMVIPLLTTSLSNTTIKLRLYRENPSWSSINNFTNLQELDIEFCYGDSFEGFEKLRYTNFPQLQILKMRYTFPRDELLKFLEINGRNLKELYLGDLEGDSDDSLNLAIAKFCTNLRKLSTVFKNDKLETLKMVFNGCQYLESIIIWCCGELLSEKDALEAVVKYSPKNIRELKLDYYYRHARSLPEDYHYNHVRSELLPEELESFFISWTNRIPQNSLYFVINNCTIVKSLYANENIKLIFEKYNNLGVIKIHF